MPEPIPPRDGAPLPAVDYRVLLDAFETVDTKMQKEMGALGLVASEEVVLAALFFRWHLDKTSSVLREVVKDDTYEKRWRANHWIRELSKTRNRLHAAARADLQVPGRGVPSFLWKD